MTRSSTRLRYPCHDRVRGQARTATVALVTNNDEAGMPNCMTSTTRILTQLPRLAARQPTYTLAALLQLVLRMKLRRAAHRNQTQGSAQAGDAPPDFVDTDWAWKEVPPPR